MFKFSISDDLSDRSHVNIFWCLAVALTVLIFLADLKFPLGVAAGVPYVAVVLVAWWLPYRRNVIALALITSLLTVAGYILSPPGGIAWIVATNRSLALFAIWSVAILVIRRKQAETMVLESRDNLEIKVTERTKELRKLSVAIEQSPVSIVITDLKGTIEYVNPQFTKISGYTFEEAIGQNPRILSSGKNDPKIYEDMWSTLLDGQTWNGDLLNKNKSGEVLWETVNISPITTDEGEITHYVGVKEDITDRKRREELAQISEEQARESEARLLEILEQSPYGVSISSLQSKKRLYMNHRFIEMFLGKADSELQDRDALESYDDPEQLEKNWAEFERRGFITGKEEIRKRLDESTWWCLSDWRLITFGDEKAVMVWHYDITDRKKEAEELEKAHKRSERFNKLATGRELRMIEMKKEVDELLEKMGEEPRYP
ncbi:MAG: PAS domain S-box protein [Rhodospirillales bacterium]